MEIEFVASVAVVTPDPPLSRKLFVDAIGLPLTKHADDEYYFSEAVQGAKHFGVWPLSQAAEACFGTTEWPADRVVPQACFEFEVASETAVAEAGAELEADGYTVLHPARTEPWGQTVVRVLSAEGVIVGISYQPWMHEA
ncbi:VOC family protein [Actinomadura sp. 6N118]|uniref:VOC family protein n=1 Tax=Actinomadura sp. 6N118 TaxID=3375151 RepID=UPI00378E8E57